MAPTAAGSGGAGPVATRCTSSLPTSASSTSASSQRRASGGPAERLVDGLPLLLSRSVCDFELYGAVHHFGSLAGGHYVALTRVAPGPGEGRWHLFDDARVVPLERPGPALDAQVASGAAYILFYVRRDIAAGWRAALAAEDAAEAAAAAAAAEEEGGSAEAAAAAAALARAQAAAPPYSVPPHLRGHSDAAPGDDLAPPLSVQQLFPLPLPSAARRALAEEAARVLAAVASPELPADGVEQGVAVTTAAGGAIAGGLAAVIGLVPGVGRLAANEAARGVVNSVGEACSAV